MSLAELEAPATEPTGESVRDLGLHWISDLVYSFLLTRDEAVSGRELLPYVNGILPVGPKTLKLALEQSPRILRDGRRWTVKTVELDAKRPLERSIITLIEEAGLPLSVDALGRQLVSAYPREEEAMADLVARMVKGRRDFFLTGPELLGLSSWLLDPNAGNPEDVEFENFEDTTELDSLRSAAESVDWSNTTLLNGAIRLLDGAGKPISTRVLQYYLWRAKPQRFNPDQWFKLLYEQESVRLISPARWIGPATVAAIREELNALEATAEVELNNEDVPKPITVEAEDIDAFAERLTEAPIRITDLLKVQFPDLRADDPNYPTTLNSLDKIVRSDPRFMWVGWDRWTVPQEIPNYSKRLPSSLDPIVVDIEISAGQQEDIELEDDGLEGTLAQEIQNPLVKYGGSVTKANDGSLRCTTTYGVRLEGILPIGDDPSIFPKMPEFLLIHTTDEVGEERAHWINNELRTLYNMGEWYTSVNLPASGAVFTLEPKDGPGDYEILYDDERDPETYLEQHRIKDLITLQQRVVAQQTSTREIIQEILSHHSKGVSFPELYAEVIVVRMTSARMIASILSGYYEFYPKGRLWLFNERDAEKGFKKQKKKYLRRR